MTNRSDKMNEEMNVEAALDRVVGGVKIDKKTAITILGVAAVVGVGVGVGVGIYKHYKPKRQHDLITRVPSRLSSTDNDPSDY